MTATHHPVVHCAVHPCRERNSFGEGRMRVARNYFVTRAKHRAGLERPHFLGLQPPKTSLGSLQPSLACPRLEKTQNRGKHMPVINKPPQIVERKYQLEDLVADAAEQYAGWIGSTTDHVVNSAVKMMLWRDKSFLAWRKSQDTARKNGQAPKPTAKA
jgi:hypothetical protein